MIRVFVTRSDDESASDPADAMPLKRQNVVFSERTIRLLEA